MRKRYTYRIQMDGNGKFIIQRKKWFVWFSFKAYNTNHHDPKETARCGKWQEFSHWGPSRFAEIETAVLVLEELKKIDTRERLAEEWKTIVRER